MRSRLASVAVLVLATVSCGTRQPASTTSTRAAAAVTPFEVYCGELPCTWFDEPGACQYIAQWKQLPGGPYTDVPLLDPVIGQNSVTQDGSRYTVDLMEDGFTFDWTATRPVSFVVAANGHDANVYRYPGPVTADSALVAWNSLPLTEVLFCLEPVAPPQGSLSASATASAGFTRKWTWQIAKSSPTSAVTASVDATVAVTWAVAVQTSPIDFGWAASGTLVIANPSPVAVSGVTIDASYAGAPVVPSCPGASPLTIPAAGTITCLWTAAESAPVDGAFVATVSSPEVAAPASATASASFGPPSAEPDGCVTVTDSLVGFLGTVCANAALAEGAAARVAPWTFSYERAAGPYATCDATNTAYSVSNTAAYAAPSGRSGASTFTVAVHVPCASTGCTLTQGYWKTHSQEGPAPYDKRWRNVGPLEEDTVFFLSAQTWIEVFRTPVKGSPYYALAHQYMAAKLNVLAGASAGALGSALGSAEAFLAANGPTTRLTAAQKAEVLALADLLDRFNSGDIGPGHCDDAESGGGTTGDDDGEGPDDRCHEDHDHAHHASCRKHEAEDRAHGRCGEHRKHEDCRRHDDDDRKKRDACEKKHGGKDRCDKDRCDKQRCDQDRCGQDRCGKDRCDKQRCEKRRCEKRHDDRKHAECRAHDDDDAKHGCGDRAKHADCRDHDEKDREDRE